MDKIKLKNIMLDQKTAFNSCREGLIKRSIALDAYIRTRQVVVISGVRRCGKSSLLFLIKEEMNLHDKEYLYFNFDDERIVSDSSTLEDLYNLHIETYGEHPIIFFDEIQNVRGWEKFINRMYEQKAKIFVTGSNALLLSSEISTSLTGRNKVLVLYPFSFEEFLRLKAIECDLSGLTSHKSSLMKKEFNYFFQNGGFPLVDIEGDTELLDSYFKDILYRDIVARNGIIQVEELKQIGIYFASNVGNLFTYSSLRKITGIKSLSSIKSYLDHYNQSYLFYYLKKYDYSVSKQILNSKKVYIIDQGFAYRIGFNFSENRGRILENVVFLELIRRGNEVYYYSGKKECDFIIKKGMKITAAIQVCFSMDKENSEREYSGLIEAMKKYSVNNGVILTYDQESIQKMDGFDIKIIPVWKWLIASWEN